MAIVRNDILPSSTTIPKSLQSTITRVGGRNPFGEPMFRILLAECRTVKAAGAWKQFKANTTIDERGGLGIKEVQKMLSTGQEKLEKMAEEGHSLEAMTVVARKQTQEISEYMLAKSQTLGRCESVVTGMVDRPLYSFKGFIIEKWKPAITFGSPEDWNSLRFNGEPMAGPYPTYGDYELCAGPTPYMPSAEQCEDAIRLTFKEIDERPSTASGRAAQMLEAQDAQEKALERENFNKVENILKEDKMLYKTSSLAAGRARNELAEKAGIREHYGN